MATPDNAPRLPEPEAFGQATAQWVGETVLASEAMPQYQALNSEYGRPVTREEVEQHENRANQANDIEGYHRSTVVPGPAPRPGVTMAEHLQRLRDLGYKF